MGFKFILPGLAGFTRFIPVQLKVYQLGFDILWRNTKMHLKKFNNFRRRHKIFWQWLHPGPFPGYRRLLCHLTKHRMFFCLWCSGFQLPGQRACIALANILLFFLVGHELNNTCLERWGLPILQITLTVECYLQLTIGTVTKNSGGEVCRCQDNNAMSRRHGYCYPRPKMQLFRSETRLTSLQQCILPV